MESNELQRNLVLIVLKLWLDLIFIVALAILCKYPLLCYNLGRQAREKIVKLWIKP